MRIQGEKLQINILLRIRHAALFRSSRIHFRLLVDEIFGGRTQKMMLFQNILLHSVKLYVQTGSQGFGHDRQLDMLSLILTTYIGFFSHTCE